MLFEFGENESVNGCAGRGRIFHLGNIDTRQPLERPVPPGTLRSGAGRGIVGQNRIGKDKNPSLRGHHEHPGKTTLQPRMHPRKGALLLLLHQVAS